jgi:hypothetical protein
MSNACANTTGAGCACPDAACCPGVQGGRVGRTLAACRTFRKADRPGAIRQATQQELAESHHRLDDAEYRFHRLLAWPAGSSSCFRLQRVLDPLRRPGILRQRLWLREALPPSPMVLLASDCDQGRDLGLDAGSPIKMRADNQADLGTLLPFDRVTGVKPGGQGR